jgi:plasmid stabilization system protein ParE
MTYRVVIEPTAAAGIRASVAWYMRNASPAVAARWYNGLIRKIDTLRKSPRRCPRAEEDEDFAEEIRVLLYGKRRGIYRVLFTIREDAVHILYVRHGAQGPVTPDEGEA